MQRMEQTEQSLEQQFNFCEGIINDVLKDGLGDSKSAQRNVSNLFDILGIKKSNGFVRPRYFFRPIA